MSTSSRSGLRYFRPSRKHREPVPNCPMPETDDDELPPCVGEAMRDVLAERAIATLADNEGAA